MATFRIPANWRELDAERSGLIPCACGCGHERRVVDDRGRRRRFIYGHVGNRPRGRRWTARENERLVDLWERGATDRTIARRLGRTPATVVAQRSKILARLGRGDRFYTRDVARIFGVTQTTVRNWINRTWLQAHLSGYVRVCRGMEYRAWWCTAEEIRAFMADGRYWGRWWLEDMPPGHWRELAGEVRGAVRLLSTEEVGRRLGFVASHVISLIRDGRLRGVRGCTRYADGRKGSRAWYVRSDQLALATTTEKE